MDAITPELLAELRRQKPAVIDFLRSLPDRPRTGAVNSSPLAADVIVTDRVEIGRDGWPVDCVPAPPPCKTCDGSMFWWPAYPHGAAPQCLRCDPPTAAVAWLDRVARLKARRRDPTAGESREHCEQLQKAMAPAANRLPESGAHLDIA